jgi:hypothetical protein
MVRLACLFVFRAGAVGSGETTCPRGLALQRHRAHGVTPLARMTFEDLPFPFNQGIR